MINTSGRSGTHRSKNTKHYQNNNHSQLSPPKPRLNNAQYGQALPSSQQIPSSPATKSSATRALVVQPTPIIIRVPHDLRDSPTFIRSEQAKRRNNVELNRPSFSSTDLMLYHEAQKGWNVVEADKQQVLNRSEVIDTSEKSSDNSSSSDDTSSSDESSSDSGNTRGVPPKRAADGTQGNSTHETGKDINTSVSQGAQSKTSKKKSKQRNSLKRKLFPLSDATTSSAFHCNDLSSSKKAKQQTSTTNRPHEDVHTEPASEHKLKRARLGSQAAPTIAPQTAASPTSPTMDPVLQKALVAIFTDLNRILPPQYITQAQTSTGIKLNSQPTLSVTVNGQPAHPPSSPTSQENQLVVLSASRTYIRDISARTALMIGSTMQTQLVRIATDRENRIKVLEREVERLGGGKKKINNNNNHKVRNLKTER